MISTIKKSVIYADLYFGFFLFLMMFGGLFKLDKLFLIILLATCILLCFRGKKNNVVLMLEIILFAYILLWTVVLLNQKYYFILFLRIFLLFELFQDLSRQNILKLEQFLTIIYLLLGLNLLFSFAEYINLFGIRDYFYNTIFSGILNRLITVRINGLNTGFDLNGIIIAVMSAFTIYYYSIQKGKRGITYGLILIQLFLICSSSRTGVLVFGIVLLFHFKAERWSKNKMLFRILVIGVAALGIISIVLYMLFGTNTNSALTQLYNFIFEGFVNLKKTGNFYYASVNDMLKNHYFLPQNLITLILGNGLMNASQVRFTDVGYIQIIFGLGIMGLFLVSVFYFCMYIGGRKRLKEEYHLKQLYTIIFFSVFLSSFKGGYILESNLIYIFVTFSGLIYGRGPVYGKIECLIPVEDENK
ncbi:hypothetical protein CRH03_22905 [Clostridium sp. HMb25]|nr:hypothetical protein CRH03_22905 [Clostridium sp. HMb25]